MSDDGLDEDECRYAVLSAISTYKIVRPNRRSRGNISGYFSDVNLRGGFNGSITIHKYMNSRLEAASATLPGKQFEFRAGSTVTDLIHAKNKTQEATETMRCSCNCLWFCGVSDYALPTRPLRVTTQRRR